MSRNVPVQINDEGTVVATINGRDELVGTLRVLDRQTVQLRLDDADRPDFWAEVTIDIPALLSRLVELRAAEAVQDNCPGCGEMKHEGTCQPDDVVVVCRECGQPVTMPSDDYCGDCSPF